MLHCPWWWAEDVIRAIGLLQAGMQAEQTLLMRPEMIFSMMLAGLGLPPLALLLA